MKSAGGTGVRAEMIAGAQRLLAERGLQGTSFAEVLELTGAPRGSVYHHFPGGKHELVQCALELSDQRMSDLLGRRQGAPAVEVVEYFLLLWREVLVRSGFRAGCAVTAVTVATDSPELRERAAGAFRSSRTQLAALLVEGGLDASAAPAFAALLVSAAEGAVVLCRAEQSLEPLEAVAGQLIDQARRLSPEVTAPSG